MKRDARCKSCAKELDSQKHRTDISRIKRKDTSVVDGMKLLFLGLGKSRLLIGDRDLSSP
jgi:hypothetical protein